ncbi:hypothetical protein GP486_007174 [Trichoglossum hirsutum]|uniref:C2H2-type domain-containing protein n=1 Tax=Trichoglossum hirsutum TaxID=265104 RepID=A0A9P8L301_9PEZI|nr:hypothetical protein GP486_007174 [Trichoglossum hirsutum]
MKKHIKRHTRPFGCTYPSCNRLFGSKNDWKRHENTQHFQLEMWRCHEKDSTGKECAKLFYRREAFQAHLRQHGITSMDRLREEARSRRIGRNGQHQFWCGFCRREVPLKCRGLDAWDERFNHIGVHYAQDKKKIEEWIPVDSNRPKGDTWPEIRTEEPTESREPREAEGHKGDCPKDEVPKDEAPKDGGPKEDDANAVRRPSPETTGQPDPSQSPAAATYESQESNAEVEKYCVSRFLQDRDLQEADISRPQCVCRNGPWAISVHTHCQDCNHLFCDECNTVNRTYDAANDTDYAPTRKRKRPRPRS